MSKQGVNDRSDRGYMMVALMALMTVMAIAALAAAPSIQQQVVREREEEAIFRGQQVADAIHLYMQTHGNQLPTSMDQLLEGIPRGTQKVQILRREAARDPLSTTGEWRLIGPTDSRFVDFQKAVAVYAGGTVPQTRDPALQRFAMQITNVLNTGASQADVTTSSDEEDTGTGGPKPFLGVASRSKSAAVITYYGIDHHNEWVFTPLFK